jgi:hypothetical protein
MEPIRKTLNDKTFEWNPDAYGKGGWFVVNNSGKLSPAKREESEQLGKPPTESKPKTKDITKIVNGEAFIWKQEALGGKGAWYVLGTKGGLVRLAGAKESKKLGDPNKQPKVAKVKVAPVQTETQIEDEEVTESDLSDRVLRQKERDKTYSDASSIRKTALTSLIAEKLISGEGIAQSIKGSISDKMKAQATGLKERFDFRKKLDPINIGKALGGNLGAALVGRMTNRSAGDIAYHTDLPKKSKRVALERANKKDPLHTKVTPGSVRKVNKDDTLADVLAKLYNLTLKIDEEERKREELNRDLEKTKQEHLEKTGKVGKTATKEDAKKTANGLFNFLENFQLFDFLKTLASKTGKLLLLLGEFLISPVGLALIGLTSFAALSIWLSGFLTDYIKKYMPDYSKITREESSSLLDTKNGKASDRDLINAAEKILGRDEKGNPKKVKDVNEAKEIIQKYSETGEVDPNAGYVPQTIDDTKTKGTKAGTRNQKIEQNRLERGGAPKESDMDQNDRKIKSLSSIIDAPDITEGEKLQQESATNAQLQQEATGTNNSIVNSPTTNIINSSGGDVLMEQLTGVRTQDPTLNKLMVCNYRWV